MKELRPQASKVGCVPWPFCEGVKPKQINIAKIASWPVPKTPRQVAQLVAMGSYYRLLETLPMVELTRKVKNIRWTVACRTAFKCMKKALLSTDIIGYPLNDGGDFILDVDASDMGIGGNLYQVLGDRERVIAYANSSLNKANCNYCIAEMGL